MIGIVLLIVGLTCINGFFAASEMALVSITPSQLYKMKRQGVQHVDSLEQVTKDSTRYLSTIQVAITFAGFLSSAFAGSSLSGRFVTWFGSQGIILSNEVMVIIITLILSYFTLVFGELVPKRIALSKSKSIALFSAPIIRIVMTMFRPFVWLLSLSTSFVLRVIGLSKTTSDSPITEADVKEMIVFGHIKGLYPSEEKAMLERIFQLDDLTAGMIMTPMQEIVSLDLDDLSDRAVSHVMSSRFSRIPVFKGHYSTIQGYLLVKDILLKLDDQKLEEIELKPHIRQPLIIDTNITINIILSQMRDLSIHMAFVVNKNGVTIGIVTLEDIMEEIVGNIYDEHDDEDVKETHPERLTYVIDGSMSVGEIEHKIGHTIGMQSPKSSKISQLIQDLLGYLPEPGEPAKVDFPYGTFEVLRVQNKAITQLRLTVLSSKQ